MSILIKGMEMPTSCAGCPTCREGTSLDGDYWLMCGYNGKPLESEIGAGKPDWCPLVPVPTHGRLMDIDAPYEIKLSMKGKTNSVDVYGRIVLPADTAEEGEL